MCFKSSLLYTFIYLFSSDSLGLSQYLQGGSGPFSGYQ